MIVSTASASSAMPLLNVGRGRPSTLSHPPHILSGRCTAQIPPHCVLERTDRNTHLMDKRVSMLRCCAVTQDQSGSCSISNEEVLVIHRRTLLVAAPLLLLPAAWVIASPHAALAEVDAAKLALDAPAPAKSSSITAPSGTVLYTNAAQGYQVSVPSTWDKIDKAGADVLFEDPARRSTSLGITVSPVRVANISTFGSLEVVGEKLLEAERCKDSTLSAAMLSQRTMSAVGSDALLYQYEYDLDSTRGRKIILNTVTIYMSKLYILNGMYKCEKEDADCNSKQAQEVVGILQTLASSFQVL